MPAVVKVTTKDKEELGIPVNQVKMFRMIDTMMKALPEPDEETGGTGGEEEATTIPISTVSTDVLRLILKWTEYHENDPESSDDEEDEQDRRVDDIPQWDTDFIKQLVKEDGAPGGDLSKLYELMQACNFLDVRLLLTFCCKFVAARMKDLTVEQARAQFHMENDYTPEEEAQLKLDNAWAEKEA